MTKTKFNFNIVQVWIKREISKEIQLVSQERPCVLLTGARQTGKSSLLEKTFPEYNYLSLDLPSLASEAKENGGYFLEKNCPPLIIDEIQYAPELFRFLKIAIDQKRNEHGRYLLTGSQKFHLMKGINESLSGRISIFECHSLSLREIYLHQKCEWTTPQVLQWMIQGGYPEVHAHQLNPQRFYADYVATYLERDVRQLVNVKDLTLFDKFLRLLALRSGQLLSYNSIANQVGVSSHTIKNWISILEASNIIFLLKPFYQNYGKRLVKSPKLYFLDSGLLCFLAGIHSVEALESSSLLGAYFETLALGQMVRNFTNQGLPINLYFFRDNHGHEVDFIIPEGTKLTAFECKWKYQSGKILSNLHKFKSLVGEENFIGSKIITSSFDTHKISSDCEITNLIKL